MNNLNSDNSIDLKPLYGEIKESSFSPGSSPRDYPGFTRWNQHKRHIWHPDDKNKTLYYKNGIWYGFARIGKTDNYDIYNCGINPHCVGMNRINGPEEDNEGKSRFRAIRNKRIPCIIRAVWEDGEFKVLELDDIKSTTEE